jgi:hypothetical protein
MRADMQAEGADKSDIEKRVTMSLRRMDEAPLVIAVDCPSGVDCDSGEAADETIPADLTVTMAAVKQGFLKLPAFELIGELEVVDIGLPDDLASFKDVHTEVAEEDSVGALLPERPLESHKGTFGTALIAAGSVNYTGAVLLAGEAAYRAGDMTLADKVTGALKKDLADQLAYYAYLGDMSVNELYQAIQDIMSNKADNLSNRQKALFIDMRQAYALQEYLKNMESIYKGGAAPALEIPGTINNKAADSGK